MLSTKNLPAPGNSSLRKTLSPGNHTVTIHDLELKAGYDEGSYNLVLHVEGPDLGPDFEGFLMDKNNPAGGRYAGQVARIRATPLSFKDTVRKTGQKVSRDTEILMFVDRLAMALDVKDLVDDISAATIEEFVAKAKRIIVRSGNLLAICAGAREYTNRSGYKEHDLFLPYSRDGKAPFTPAADTQKLMVFEEKVHILPEKQAKPLTSFEPDSLSGPGNDFSFM